MNIRSSILLVFATMLGVFALTAAPAIAALETPESEKVSAVTATTAHVSGVLNPKATGGVEGGFWGFQFGVSEPGVCGAERILPEPFPGAGVAAGLPKEVVEEVLTGLQPHAKYTVCLLELNAGETEQLEGMSVPFETESVPPEVVVGAESASPVTASEAGLSAQINPNNEATSYVFEYATKETAGVLEGTIVKVKDTSPVEGYPAQAVSASTGKALSPGTTYYYRVVAENAQSVKEGKSVDGAVEEFTTAAMPRTEAPNPISSSTATFKGKLTPLNKIVPTEYFFRYSVGEELVCTNADATTPESAGTGLGTTKEVSTAVTGLQPNQKYTVCLVAKNASGAEEEDPASPPVHFTTKPAPPTIESESVVLPVKAHEVHLEGVVNPNNQVTECHFQYGEKALSLYDEQELSEKTVACTPELLKGYPGQGVGLAVGGLPPKTVYHYRIVAKNGTSEEELGKEKEFETATPPETPTVPTSPEPVTGITSSEATLHGVLNPGAVGDHGSYEVRYRKSATECQGGNPGEEKKTSPAGSSGSKEEPAEATVTELLPGTQYTFCLLAKNEAGEEAIGPPVTFTTLTLAPTIADEFASKAEQTAATLDVQIDPNGAETKYHFEYGPTEAYGTSSPETTLTGSLTATDTATVTIAGLQPSTTYHYRVVASNVVGGKTETADGPDKTFTTNPEPSTAPETCPNAKLRAEQPYGLTLPDCRAYEMVSPLDKNDGGVSPIGARAAVSGEALTFTSKSSYAEPRGAALLDRYLSRRTADGWSTQSISPMRTLGNLNVPFGGLYFSPELSKGVVESLDDPLVSGEPVGYENLYVADTEDGAYQTVTTNTAELDAQWGQNYQYPAGVSTDLSHVVFQQVDGFNRENEIYEWADGKVARVDIPPEGTTGTGFTEREADAVVGCGCGPLNYPTNKRDTWHAVSADGSRVFFTGDARGGEYHGQIYVRENPMAPVEDCAVPGDACTVEVSASQKTNGSGPGGTDPIASQPYGEPYAYFQDASANGEKVFFTSKVELTNDANTGDPAGCKGFEQSPSGDCAENLYEYDVVSGKLTDLSVDDEPGDGAAVLGLVTASEDGSYVYFVANGVLAHNRAENGNGDEEAKPGDCLEADNQMSGALTCSLYVEHYNGAEWEAPKFIATLGVGRPSPGFPTNGDETDWTKTSPGSFGGGPEQYGPGSHTVRVTPDGTTLAFQSERQLTGFDNEHAEPGECEQRSEVEGIGTGRCTEVYIYNAVSEKVVCVSCGRSGARPIGNSILGGKDSSQTELQSPPNSYLARNLSEDGRRLFFESRDALVPHTSNGLKNVYEWEAEGEGSCKQANGCVYPISDVAGDDESKFLDASPNGENVFIDTADQLVPADTDTREDAYDVRVDGGFPVTTAPPACDNGDSCKPPVSPQPSVFAPVGSATFSGIGNFPPAVVPPPPKKVTKKTVKCAKGKKLSHGECTKKKSKKSKQAKRAGNDRRTK